MKPTHILLALILTILAAYAATLASRPPRIETVEKLFQGITYSRLIRSTPRPLVVHIVDIDLTAPGVQFLVTPGDTRCGLEFCAMTTGAFVKKYDLQLAINGGFFDPFDASLFNYYPRTYDPVNIRGLVISNSIRYSEDDERFARLCFTPTEAQITWGECPIHTTQALAGGEMIVQDGAARDLSYDSAFQPRTAVAGGNDGQRVWLIVVDGRQKNYSEGVSLNELASLIVDLGATTALNMDGGGSTTLVVSKNGIHPLNSPIHTRIPLRQRPIANHLGVYAIPLPRP